MRGRFHYMCRAASLSNKPQEAELHCDSRAAAVTQVVRHDVLALPKSPESTTSLVAYSFNKMAVTETTKQNRSSHKYAEDSVNFTCKSINTTKNVNCKYTSCDTILITGY